MAAAPGAATADATHIFFQNGGVHRRIFTDGRTWPKDVEPAFFGYSIGKWFDGDGDGRFDTLTADTRYFKGPRVFDATGIPLHEDNETVIKEASISTKRIPIFSMTR